MHCYKSPVNAVKKGEWSSTEYTNACHCCNVRISLHCDALDNRLINIISNIIIVYIFARMSTNREERGNPLRILEENIIYHNKTHALHLPIEQWEYYPLGINFYLTFFSIDLIQIKKRRDMRFIAINWNKQSLTEIITSTQYWLNSIETIYMQLLYKIIMCPPFFCLMWITYVWPFVLFCEKANLNNVW